MAKSEFENFENAPIVLAILQIRYAKIDQIDIKKLRKIGEQDIRFQRRFPTAHENVTANLQFGQLIKGETNVTVHNKEISGLTFNSSDKSEVLTIEKEKFTYQVSGKYIGGDKMLQELKKFWQLFGEHLEPQINGVSTRIVNKIDLPVDTKEVSKYFSAYIHTNKNQKISSFQFKYTTVEENNIIVHVGHSLETKIDDYIPYILDIDVICLGDFSTKPDLIWENFENLRTKKNQIFDDSITEETKKLIR